MYQHEIGICLLAENLLVEYHFIEVLSLLVLAGRNCKSHFNDKSTGIMTALILNIIRGQHMMQSNLKCKRIYTWLHHIIQQPGPQSPQED